MAQLKQRVQVGLLARQQPFHARQRVAQLKLVDDRSAVWFAVGFPRASARGPIEAQRQTDPVVDHEPFHARQRVAQLKLSSCARERVGQFSFPRASARGAIEAE